MTPRKRGRDSLNLGNDPIFKGSWQVREGHLQHDPKIHRVRSVVFCFFQFPKRALGLMREAEQEFQGVIFHYFQQLFQLHRPSFLAAGLIE